ncbi:flagellar hook-length control protein FliK, partial [Burkholderia pseudomallei]|nr:flagellar hook-length control protein FliK [Burkholderia pseudomallei]
MLLGAASTMIKSSAGAPGASSGDASSAAPFAQALKQSVQTQRQTGANADAPNAGHAANAATADTAAASSPASGAGDRTTASAGDTKASGKPDDQDDDK